MKRLLFLCSQNKLRSPTAETIFCGISDIEVDSAGLNKGAIVYLSDEQVEWADIILVMEKAHRAKLNQNYRHLLAGKRITVLGIPDKYDFMDKELIKLLKTKCAPYIP